MSPGSRDLVFTTDSYVIDPIFFPGGDIGRLAVCGTVNDLAMQGGEPRALSLGLILEEGLLIRDLERIMESIGATVAELGVPVVTGDTKVVERGRCNGVYLNTSGIGERLPGVDLHAGNARPGDSVLVSGSIGDHGASVMLCRKALGLRSEIVSDVAALWPMIGPLLEAYPGLRFLRDPTRGGLASALCDVAEASKACVRIREPDIPVRGQVRAACELLGLEPLTMANEGKAVVVCSPADSEPVLALLRSHPLGRDAVRIGRVEAGPAGRVLMETAIGGERILDRPMGDDQPRIC